MSKTIWHTMMSLDGYVAGRDDAMEWAFGHGGSPAGLVDETREAIGAIVAGRRWYEIATARHDGAAGIYGGRWSGPVFVLTHRPEEIAGDRSVEAHPGPLEAALATARKAAGEKAVGILGAEIARQAVEAGEVDEIVVHVAPVMLGDGVRFYGEGASQVELERIGPAGGDQVIDLRYRVRRD